MEVLTPTEAAEFLHISRPTLDRLKRYNHLNGTYYHVGARVLFIKSKLQAWAESGGTLNSSN